MTDEQVTVDDDVTLFNITQLYRSDMSEHELYEATRGIWRVGEKREKASYAFAVYEGIVREIYKINTWHKAGTLSYETRDFDENELLKRWEFEGVKADEHIRAKYLKKSVRQYRRKGNQNPVKYINCS